MSNRTLKILRFISQTKVPSIFEDRTLRKCVMSLRLMRKNSTFFIPNRSLSSRCHCPDQIKAKEDEAKACPNLTCTKKKKRKSLWGRFFEKKEKPPIESCRMRQNICKPDPDLSFFGGKVYKTCGSAYVVEKTHLPVEEETTSKEQVLIARIEAPLGSKHDFLDPMPSFRSVAQRLLDLQDRRLHPFYKRYQGLSKRKQEKTKITYPQYKNINLDVILTEDIPKKIKFNRDLLEKKNLYSEFKKVEPPKHLVGRMIEHEKNVAWMGSGMGKNICRDVQKPKKKREVYDTLHQKEGLF